MTEQILKSNQNIFWVDRYDEEDWRHLFMCELLEDFEDGKTFLRVN